MVRRGTLALCCGVLLLAVLGAGSAVAADGSISGTVTDASTLDPIEGIEVCAWALEEEDFGCAFTAANGTYTILGLAPGEYEVEFWSEGDYAFQVYDGKASWVEADPVTVSSGLITPGIDAAMEPAARIQGSVTAAVGGAPVEEVEVCAWTAVEEEFSGCTYTEPDGSYSLGRLEPNGYKVEFWTGSAAGNYRSQLYDHKYEWSEADVVTVAAGETKTGIDAALDPGGEISGRVVAAANGVSLGGILVCSVTAADGRLWSCTETRANGGYALRRFPPGQYKIAFSLEFREFFPEEEPEDDGWPTQFFNGKTTLGAADTLSLGSGSVIGGVDARLGPPPPTSPPALGPPPVAFSVTKPKPKRCKAGFKRKKVRGKVRCVRVHRHKRRHHRAGPHRLGSAHEGAGPAGEPGGGRRRG